MDKEVKITASAPLKSKEAAQVEDSFNPTDMLPLLPGEKYPSMAEVLSGISNGNNISSSGWLSGWENYSMTFSGGVVEESSDN